MVVFIAGVTVFAADDASKAVSNLTATVCNIVTALGVLLALWGVVQFGLSLSGHDPSQRNQALLQLIGGILVAVAPQLLKSILQGTSVDTSAIPVGGHINILPLLDFFIIH